IKYVRRLQIIAGVEKAQVHRELRVGRPANCPTPTVKKIAVVGTIPWHEVRIEERRRKPVLVVVSIYEGCEAHLSEVVQAGRLLGHLFRARQRGQEHAGQNGDNRYYHQQFDKGEAASLLGGCVLVVR